MSVTAWRIVKKAYAGSAFSGQGANLYGGRWNNPGTPVVYTSGSQALAAMELLTGMEMAALSMQYVTIPVTIPETMVRTLAPLPDNWREIPPGNATKEAGDAWAKAGETPVLSVPSVVIPEENNYLLNPVHPEFAALHIGRPGLFLFDKRLVYSATII